MNIYITIHTNMNKIKPYRYTLYYPIGTSIHIEYTHTST